MRDVASAESARAAGRLALALACAAASSNARASDVSPQLGWRAPAECPTEAQVWASLSGLLAPQALHWERFDAVRGSVTHAGAEWELGLEFVTGAEVRRRTLHATECRDLADAAAVAIVLALNSPEAGSAANPPAPGVADPADAAREPSPRSGTASEPLGIELRVEGLLDANTLGDAAFGVGGALRGRIGAFSAALYGFGLPAVRTQLGTGEGIELGLWAGGLRGCWRLRGSVGVCASGEAGRLSARGVGLQSAARSRDWWLTPGVSVELSAPLFEAVWLHSSVAGLLPLVRSRFRVDEREVVYQLPMVAVRLGLGLEVALP